MGGKSSPKPPDPADTAKAQMAASKDAVKESAKVNQFNQVTPFGSVTYSGTIGKPSRTQTVTLTPEQQRVLDSQNAIAGGIGELGLAQLGRVGETMSSNLDFSGLPGVGTGMEARDAATNALLDRLQPRMERDQLALENRLANQGISRGSEAYGAAMDDISRAQTDARLAAVAQGGAEQQRQFGMDQALRNQLLQETMLQRQQPINELAALLQGSPAISTVQPQQVAQYNMPAPDITGMTMANYQAQMQDQQSRLGGLYGLGSAGLMAGAMM